MKKDMLTKKTVKKLTKKLTKKSRAKKSRVKKTLSREKKIEYILRLVREIGDYASENLCVQPAQMEELEWELRQAIK